MVDSRLVEGIKDPWTIEHAIGECRHGEPAAGSKHTARLRQRCSRLRKQTHTKATHHGLEGGVREFQVLGVPTRTSTCELSSHRRSAVVSSIICGERSMPRTRPPSPTASHAGRKHHELTSQLLRSLHARARPSCGPYAAGVSSFAIDPESVIGIQVGGVAHRVKGVSIVQATTIGEAPLEPGRCILANIAAYGQEPERLLVPLEQVQAFMLKP
jgi:hypothetical protein